MKIVFKFFLYLTLPFVFMSCSQGSEESAIAKKITFTTSTGAIVLQNTLKDTLGQTCVAGGVAGPRVRMRAAIKWEGDGNLLPLVIMLRASDSRLSAEMKGTLSPGASNSESLAFMFGLTTDYIPSSSTTFALVDCFLDYGSLPKPKQEVTGAGSLEVPVTVQMTGVVRDAEGNDTPFVKEIGATIKYVAGSIPP